jgi:hypothetical protein
MSHKEKSKVKPKKYSDSDNNFTESDPSVKNTSKDEEAEIKKKAKESFIQADFYEKVIKYVKTDNLIRKESTEFREKINTLKEEKQDLENFILKYLDLQEENVININGSGKLTKYESIRKKGINKDIIQQAIYDQIKKEKLITDENKIKDLVEATYNVMEGKREKTTKTVLKRTFIKEKKPKVEKVEKVEKPKKIKKEKNK